MVTEVSYTLKFTKPEIDAVVGYLGRKPYQEVAPILGLIQQKLNESQMVKPAESTEPIAEKVDNVDDSGV